MDTTLAVLLIITGFGMIVFWVMHILNGGLSDGLKTVENGGYIGFHIFIELLTGCACILAGVSMFTGVVWSPVLVPVAAGMLLYTCINSLAWSEVRNKPVVAVMFIVPGLVAIVTIVYYLV